MKQVIPRSERILEKLWLSHPTSTIQEMCDMSGYSSPTVIRAKNKLRQKGLLDSSRRSQTAIPDKPAAAQTSIVDAAQLLELATSDLLDEGLESEDETRKKLLKQVQRLALDPNIHPDTRLSATQVWVKLKDIARTKDLGPGLPRSREEIEERLVRLMQAVGVKLTLSALEIAFKKENTDAEAPNVEIPASTGTSEPSESTGHEAPQAETTS